uniref:Carbamoyl phosphate synthase small chain n=1 Tax=Lophocladia kuetzingii TaxID=675577 RepID=A0A1Z1MNQ1_9FLOR|nr:carbamoyl phosphate synthase small subunit [Lophocladia kuetzingii]ARW67556.1 carbamoyl phosphate synthase small subunit [Lophocladia kuetzingii]
MVNTLYPAVLYLQDGTIYKGWSLFQLSIHFGEIVFNTGMTGYQEIFTDPSYSGQFVVFTYPELGNTGLNKNDNESNFIHVKGFISKNISCISSNWRSNISLKDYVLLKRIPHIFGIDTRALTKHLRLLGVMNAVFSDANKKLNLSDYQFNNLDKLDLVKKVTTRHIYSVKNLNLPSKSTFFYLNSNINKYVGRKKNIQYKIVVIDFGLKFNILRKLLYYGCDICVVPSICSYKTILDYNPNGILLSNGPGNPISIIYAINTVKKLVYFANVPIFGICMGHQVLNLALGAETFKLNFGHRGLNHPSGLNNYSEITSQNHGFAVKKTSVGSNQLDTFIKTNYFNLNDLTISSIIHKNLPLFSVQYHPESSPGPHDSEYLFMIFIKLIEMTYKKSLK